MTGKRTAHGELANTIKVLADELDAMTRDRDMMREYYLNDFDLKEGTKGNPLARLRFVGIIVRWFPDGYTEQVAERLCVTQRHAGRLINLAREAGLAPPTRRKKS